MKTFENQIKYSSKDYVKRFHNPFTCVNHFLKWYERKEHSNDILKDFAIYIRCIIDKDNDIKKYTTIKDDLRYVDYTYSYTTRKGEIKTYDWLNTCCEYFTTRIGQK